VEAVKAGLQVNDAASDLDGATVLLGEVDDTAGVGLLFGVLKGALGVDGLVGTLSSALLKDVAIATDDGLGLDGLGLDGLGLDGLSLDGLSDNLLLLFDLDRLGLHNRVAILNVLGDVADGSLAAIVRLSAVGLGVGTSDIEVTI